MISGRICGQHDMLYCISGKISILIFENAANFSDLTLCASTCTCMCTSTQNSTHVYPVYVSVISVCVYGGGSRREQVNIVSKGVEIVIG